MHKRTALLVIPAVLCTVACDPVTQLQRSIAGPEGLDYACLAELGDELAADTEFGQTMETAVRPREYWVKRNGITVSIIEGDSGEETLRLMFLTIGSVDQTRLDQVEQLFNDVHAAIARACQSPMTTISERCLGVVC